ncbi:hypothetical protein [Anaerosporobacter sp.]
MKGKHEIRRYIKELKKNLSEDEIEVRSKRIADKFFAQPYYKQANNIYMYPIIKKLIQSEL